MTSSDNFYNLAVCWVAIEGDKMLLSPHWRSFLFLIERHFTLREYYVVLESNVYRKKNNCDALRNLLPFVRFKKREKQPWKSVIFKPVTLLKITLLHGYFSRFLNFTNSTKSRNASHICFRNFCVAKGLSPNLASNIKCEPID